MRQLQWAQTLLGSPGGWPGELRYAVDMMLASPQVASVVVGPERVLLYNDAAAALYGDKHPSALGRRLPDTWPQAWADVRAHYDRVFAGESVHVPVQPLDLEGPDAGQVFEAYLTPVRDADGAVIAAYMTGSEVGARLRAEAALATFGRRQALLLQLSDAMRAINDPIGIQNSAMRLLGEHLGLSRAYCFDIERETGAHVVGDVWAREPGDPGSAGRHALESLGASLFEDLTPGEVARVADVTLLTRSTPERRAGLGALDIEAFIYVPLLRDGAYGAGVAAHHDHPHAWTDDEADVIREVAARMWTAVERTHAQKALSDSEERHHALFAASPIPFVVLSPEPPDFRFTAVNDAYLSATLTAREDLIGHRVFDVFTDDPARPGADGPDRMRASLSRVLATKRPDALPRARYDVPRLDGSFEPRWWLAINAPVLGGDGQVTAILHQVTDVTELHLAETAEQESQARQAFLLKLSDALRPLVDPREIKKVAATLVGEEMSVNRAFYADARAGFWLVTKGFERNIEPLPDGPFEMAAYGGAMIEDLRAGKRLVVSDIDTDVRFTQAERTERKALRITAVLGVPLVKNGALVAMLTLHDAEPREWTLQELRLVDETAERTWAAVERARAEAALRESGQEYRALFTAMDQGFCVIEKLPTAADQPSDYRYIVANPAFEQHIGLTAVVGKTVRELFPNAEMTTFLDRYDHVLKTGRSYMFEDHTDTIDCWMRVETFPAEKPGQVAVLFSDISVQKRAETALRESEERQAFLLKLSDAIRPISDPQTILAEASRVLGERLNVTRVCFAERDGDEFVVSRDFVKGVPSMVGRYPKEAFGRYASRVYNRSGRVVVYDAAGDQNLSEEEKAQLRAAHIASYAAVTLRKENGISIALAAHNNVARDWTNEDFELIEETAERTWAAVERARAEAELRESEEALRTSEERLRQFGEASQDILWIRDAQTLQWVYLTPAFETVYGLGREEVLTGNNYQNWRRLILPEDRDDAVASIERVTAGEWVTFEYRIRRPSDGAVRWLRDTDFPITDADGKTILIGGIGHDFTDVREAELRLQTLVEGIPQLVWRAVDGGEWTWASPQWTTYTGQERAEYGGRGWLAVLHVDDQAAAREAWSHALEHGGFEVEYRVRRRSDGAYRWFQTRAVAVRDHAGTIIEWLGTSTDIHDLRELQERQKVLVAELQHRTRNLMGVVRSTADKTVRSSGDLQDFRARFRDRLDALARVQGLLSRMNEHDRVTFDELVHAEMAAMDGTVDRVTADGPSSIRLRSSTVQTLAMALHELATNAMKYGALAQPAGRLSILWSLDSSGPDGKPWLNVDWRESGVRMPQPGSAPAGTGQGRELIEQALPYQLDAEVTYVLGSDGVHCTIRIPVSTSTEELAGHA